MSTWTSLRDVALIARFEVLRAIRTWRAVALVALYVVATTGASLIFVGLLWAMEQSIAQTLGAPSTRRPGAMMAELLQDDGLREIIGAMVGNSDQLDRVLQIPLPAIFHLWFGFLIVPFFAATAAAESIASDLRARALRFEVVRTGRLELVLGRFAGQLVLTAAATMITVFGVWGVGTFAMVGNDPVDLALSLLDLNLRLVAFSVPFVGIGLACSQLTSSPALARVLAVGGVVATWAGQAGARRLQDSDVPWLGDLLIQVLPQAWIDTLWQLDAQQWAPAAIALLAFGVVATMVGFAALQRRDL